MIKKTKNHFGFTIIELVIVAVIIGVLFGASLSLVDYQQKSGLQASLHEMTAVIRDIQKKSIAQEAGALWGIRLSRPTSGPSRYEVFQGVAYDVNKVVKSLALSRGAEFSGIPLGGFLDLFFYQNGSASEDVTIPISVLGTKFTGVIIVRASGKIVSNLERGLVGYWLFDEGAGTLALDASSKRHNGNFSGLASPSWESFGNCKSGTCLKFLGSVPENQPRVVGNFSENLPRVSIAGWVKPSNIGSGAGGMAWLIGVNQFVGELASPRKPEIYAQTSAGGEFFSLSQSLAPNIWYYLTFVYDGAARRIFVNGMEMGSSPLAGADFSSYTFILGMKAFPLPEYLDGWLDEIRIYNRALDAKEVLAQYNIMR